MSTIEEERKERKNKNKEGRKEGRKCSLTVFVLSDALQRDAKEGSVGVVVPDQQLCSSGDVHTGSVEDTGPAITHRHISFEN